MGKKPGTATKSEKARPAGKPSALLDTGGQALSGRVTYCGDCLEQLKNLPPACVDLIYIDPPFNSNRNYEVFCGETKAPRQAPSRTATARRRHTSTRLAEERKNAHASF